MDSNCIFCKINVGEIPGDFVYRDSDTFVIRDIAPKAPVHLLVIPTVHVERIAEFCCEDFSIVSAMFRAAKEAVQIEGIAERGYRLIINQGEEGGQEVPHLHMHVLGGMHLRAMGMG
ncbi:MAG: histidine triad nucleotide-binding protein [Chloroflexota bacterium]|nr:histidine triad nucleotide-binding protein [Chloroflexota bacterium]